MFKKLILSNQCIRTFLSIQKNNFIVSNIEELQKLINDKTLPIYQLWLSSCNLSAPLSIMETIFSEFKYSSSCNCQDYNTMIEKYVQNKDINSAERILSDIHSLRLKTDHRSYFPLIHYYLSNGNYFKALELCEEMKSHNIHFSKSIWHLLIKHSPSLDDSFKLYQGMKEYGLNPNLHTFTILFNCCIFYDNLDMCHSVSQEIKLFQITPSQTLFISVVQDCIKHSKWHLISFFFNQMKLYNIESASVYSLLLSNYLEKHQVEKSLKIFYQMVKLSLICPDHLCIKLIQQLNKSRNILTVLTYMKKWNNITSSTSNNLIITLFIAAKRLQSHLIIKHIFSLLSSTQLAPLNNQVLMTSIDTAMELKDTQIAISILHLIPKLSTEAVIEVIHLCLQLQDFSSSQKIIDQLIHFYRYSSNLYSSNKIKDLKNLMRITCSLGFPHQSLALMDQILLSGVKHQSWMYNILIESFCFKGLLKEAISLLHHADTFKLRLSQQAYGSIIILSSVLHDIPTGLWVFNHMEKKGYIKRDKIREKLITILLPDHLHISSPTFFKHDNQTPLHKSYLYFTRKEHIIQKYHQIPCNLSQWFQKEKSLFTLKEFIK